MKLKSFGCSFTYGSDLADCTDHQHSCLTWPALMAKKLDLVYECHAWPGIGNLQIAELILKHALILSQDFFVIGWTWIDRFDYVDATTNKWLTILPADSDIITKNYYKDLHSEYRDKLTNLMYIKLVVDKLNLAGIPFVMTYTDELLFDQRWHANEAIIDLQESIKPYMTTFEDQSFLQWSRSNGYPESERWHPLEQAHRTAADYMISVFDKQKIIDPVLQARV